MLAMFVLLATVFSISISQDALANNIYLSDESLPRDVIPISYKIKLHPDMEGPNFTFSGEVMINIIFMNQTNKINLHSENLELKGFIELRCDAKTYILSINELDTTTDILSLDIPTEATLETGSACNLTIKYEGGGNGGDNNFHRISYLDTHDEEQRMALTHFGSIAARHIFPCWDEPFFKANFIISMKHSSQYKVLSNMHEETSQIDADDPAMKITIFAESPKMTTYSVAFAIGNFTSVVNNDGDFEVWTRREVMDQAKYAVQIGPQIMKALENYINFPYKRHGFSKMQILAVPTIKFDNAAMRNWGFVILGEEQILYDEKWHTTPYKQMITRLIARKLTSQWFGHLINPEGWDSSWLVESIAKYFEYAISDEIEPTWRMMGMLVLDILKVSVHPLLGSIESNIYNSYVDFVEYDADDLYSIDASFIRMISHAIGAEQFRTAIRNYVENNAFKSVTLSNFINELETATDKNITNLGDFMKNWLDCEDYPYIHVGRDYANGTAKIMLSGNSEDCSPHWIPLNHVTEDNLNFADTKVTDWFNTNLNTETKIMKMLDNDKFVILNKQQFGLYRVNYDERNWRMIIEFLKTNNYVHIHVFNRAQLIDNALRFAKNGQLKYEIVLSLIEYLKVETDSVPWTTAGEVFKILFNRVQNTDFEQLFKDYVVEISDKLVYNLLNADLIVSDDIMKIKRAEFLEWACKFGSKSCRSKANEKLIEWLTDPEATTLPPSDDAWIMCGGMQNADQATWNMLWEKYSNNSEIKILFALGCTSNVTIMSEYVAKVMRINETKIFEKVVDAILKGSSAGINFIFQFVIDQYQEINKILGGRYGEFILNLSLKEIRATKQQYDEIKKFVKSKNIDFDDDNSEILNDLVSWGYHDLEMTSEVLNEFNTFFIKRMDAAKTF